MSLEQSGWTEEDSALYRELSAVAVPRREEQLAALVALLPFGRDEAFDVVELGCGEGVLAAAVLDAYPRAGVLCLDGSASMLREASARLERFGERARLGEVRPGVDRVAGPHVGSRRRGVVAGASPPFGRGEEEIVRGRGPRDIGARGAAGRRRCRAEAR